MNGMRCKSIFHLAQREFSCRVTAKKNSNLIREDCSDETGIDPASCAATSTSFSSMMSVEPTGVFFSDTMLLLEVIVKRSTS
jgi:hypothetical protein